MSNPLGLLLRYRWAMGRSAKIRHRRRRRTLRREATEAFVRYWEQWGRIAAKHLYSDRIYRPLGNDR